MSTNLNCDEIIEEIKRLKILICRYNKGKEMPEDFRYRTAIWTLEHLKNKLRNIKKGKENE